MVWHTWWKASVLIMLFTDAATCAMQMLIAKKQEECIEYPFHVCNNDNWIWKVIKCSITLSVFFLSDAFCNSAYLMYRLCSFGNSMC